MLISQTYQDKSNTNNLYKYSKRDEEFYVFTKNNIKNNKNNENINASLQENSNETYKSCLNVQVF